jgi:hypothetical protein
MQSDRTVVRAVGALLVAAWLVMAIARSSRGEMPHDLAAYTAAADLFWSGANPYDQAAMAAAPRNQGFLYIYQPMSLWLLWPLAHLTTEAIIALELLLRFGCVNLIAYILASRFKPELPHAYAAALVLCIVYAREDLTDGNLGTTLFALWLAVVASRPAGDGPTTAPLAPYGWSLRLRIVASWIAVVASGALFACKPLWVPLACAGLAAQRRWAACAAVAAGAAAMTAASFMQRDLWRAWLDVLVHHRAHSATYDLMASQPLWSNVLIAALWLAAALWLLARARRLSAPPPPLWIWAGVGVLAWPRYGIYDLLLLLPAICWLATRAHPWLVIAVAFALPEALCQLHFMGLGPLAQAFFTTKLAGAIFAGIILVALHRAIDEAAQASPVAP